MASYISKLTAQKRLQLAKFFNSDSRGVSFSVRGALTSLTLGIGVFATVNAAANSSTASQAVRNLSYELKSEIYDGAGARAGSVSYTGSTLIVERDIDTVQKASHNLNHVDVSTTAVLFAIEKGDDVDASEIMINTFQDAALSPYSSADMDFSGCETIFVFYGDRACVSYAARPINLTASEATANDNSSFSIPREIGLSF